MSWVQLDDQIANHPKILKAGPEAAWMWTAAIAYCQNQLTDGFVPLDALPGLGRFKSPQATAERLVDARQREDGEGLFERRDGGYAVHDYLEKNPSRADVIARLAKAAAKKKRWRERKVVSTPMSTHMSTVDTTGDTTVCPPGTRGSPGTTPTPLHSSTDQISKGSVPHAPPIPRDRARAPETTALAPLLPKNTRWAGRPAVPDFIHAELLQRLAPDETEADLLAFYARTAATWADRSIGDDNPRFWRARFAEWKGSTLAPRTKGQTVTAQNEAVLARALARRREGS